MNSKNILEINGKFYDTVSGRLVTDTVTAAPVATAPKPAKAVHTRLQTATKTPTMDIIRRQSKPAPALSTVKTVQAEPQKPVVPNHHPARSTSTKAQIHHKRAEIVPATSKPHVKPIAITASKQHKNEHAIAVHHKPHQPQSSVTLVRKAVPKPTPGFKKQINVQTALKNASETNLVVKKTSVYSVTPERVLRAQAVKQSEQISRFEHSKAKTFPVSVAPIPVQPEPNNPTEAGAPSPAPTNRPTDMFERAIQNASHFVDTKAHTKGIRKKRHQQVLSLTAASLALLLIATFALYQNTPGLQIKLASARVGFSTQLPQLENTGFAYGDVRTENGKLTLGLTEGNTTAQLVQQESNWSNADLLRQSQVGTDESGGPVYDVVKVGDTAVYRFNDSSATWIKNGIWYQLSSPTTLTDQQVKALAQNS